MKPYFEILDNPLVKMKAKQNSSSSIKKNDLVA